jgi:hypothetical protein
VPLINQGSVDDLRVDRCGSFDIHLRQVIGYLVAGVAVDHKGVEDLLVLGPHLIAYSSEA